MLVVLTETYCNKFNIRVTQRDDFIQNVFNVWWRQNMFWSINSTDDKGDLLLEKQYLLPSALFSLSLSLSYSCRLASQVN